MPCCAEDSSLDIANRIFETWLHTYLKVDDFGFGSASKKINFIKSGRIDMELVFERFSLHYNTWYAGEDRLAAEDKARLNRYVCKRISSFLMHNQIPSGISYWRAFRSIF